MKEEIPTNDTESMEEIRPSTVFLKETLPKSIFSKPTFINSSTEELNIFNISMVTVCTIWYYNTVDE